MHVIATSANAAYAGFNRFENLIKSRSRVLKLKSVINKVFSNKKLVWPDTFTDHHVSYKIKYTFRDDLTKHINRLLRRYRSDYAAVVVIENDTGNILAATGYEGRSKSFNQKLAFSATHPSASLIKIVTSAALLEKAKLSKDSMFNFRGKGTTLYKYQLGDKKTKWTRYQTLERAFAYSNNVIFGKAAINNLKAVDLMNMANNFGFNNDLMEDVLLSKSVFGLADDQYNLAELASGFNRETLIGPIHAAVLSLIIANNGVLKYPKIVDKIVNLNTNQSLTIFSKNEKKILNDFVASEVKNMMQKTVVRGTARSSFRRMRRGVKRKLLIGGKTGSITGGLPHGKRDWFTAFAIPTNDELGKGISICVMNINVKKWYIKSSFLAKYIIEYYYNKIVKKKVISTLSDSKRVKG
ncbi:MAG: hypothetical protein ISR65_04120 [Bacteriovoracaceae bacterium]|nr:hypothetical protein [Bacteriovoracaceae bacterium]